MRSEEKKEEREKEGISKQIMDLLSKKGETPVYGQIREI